MNRSDSIVNLAAALVKAQAEVENATKDATNPFFGSSYASLNSVLAAYKAVFAKHGLAVVQMPAHIEDGMAGLESIVVHESGEWISQVASAPTPVTYSKDGDPRPPDAQSVGSVITYLRRYALAAIAQIAQEDDDANAGSHDRSNQAGETIPCPKCGGAMWDNRVGKKNPKQPDLKCKSKSCDHAVWLDGLEKDTLARLDKAQQVGAIDAETKHDMENDVVSRSPVRMFAVNKRLDDLAKEKAA